jgi:hypothetical protein
MPECIFCGFACYSGWFLLFCHKNKSTNVRWPSLSHRADATFRVFLFHALRCILRASNSLRAARGKYVTDEARGQARTPAVH